MRDPYESRTVEVRESRIPGAGEGLFAVRDIGVGESVAYFAGVRVPATETSARSDYSILLGMPKILIGALVVWLKFDVYIFSLSKVTARLLWTFRRTSDQRRSLKRDLLERAL